MIESCLIMALLCLLFFGMFQLSQLFAAKEILNYAAARAARAKTVGFNRFMVDKTIEVGTIPNAGRLLHPDVPGGPAEQQAMEAARIPFYLGADRPEELEKILDYADWDTVDAKNPNITLGNVIHVEIEQDYPLRLPFHRAFYADDEVELNGEAYIEAHYRVYMEDRGY